MGLPMQAVAVAVVITSLHLRKPPVVQVAGVQAESVQTSLQPQVLLIQVAVAVAVATEITLVQEHKLLAVQVVLVL